jgi:hypothetical protein
MPEIKIDEQDLRDAVGYLEGMVEVKLLLHASPRAG